MATYDTVENADLYFAGRLHVPSWDNSSDNEKTRALTEATQRIDRLRFSGSMVDSAQDLEFPRYYGDDPDGTETVPNDLKIACFECAFALLDGVEPDLELESLHMRSQTFSDTKTTYRSGDGPEHFTAGIPSAFAWIYLRPYLGENSRTITLNRTN